VTSGDAENNIKPRDKIKPIITAGSAGQRALPGVRPESLLYRALEKTAPGSPPKHSARPAHFVPALLSGF